MTRETLRGQLWSHDTYVEFEHALNAAMNRLRLVLGDDAEPRAISRRFQAGLSIDCARGGRSSAANRGYTCAIFTIASPTAMGLGVSNRCPGRLRVWNLDRPPLPAGAGSKTYCALRDPAAPWRRLRAVHGTAALSALARRAISGVYGTRSDLLRSLWIRDLARPEAREVPETGDAYSVFWSPDGACLYYTSFASGVLRRVALSGGPQDLVAQMPPRFYGAWLYRGEIRSGDHEEGWAVPLSGGASRKLPMPQSWAQPLPDGRRVIYTAWNGARSINEVRLALPDQPGTTLFESDSRVFLTRSAEDAEGQARVQAHDSVVLPSAHQVVEEMPFLRWRVRRRVPFPDTPWMSRP